MKTATGIIKITLEGPTKFVRLFGVLPGRILATGSDEKTIRIWNTATGITTRTLEGHTNWVISLVVLPDGSLASGIDDITFSFGRQLQGKQHEYLKVHPIVSDYYVFFLTDHLLVASMINHIVVGI